jgi:hypothetical protein
MKRCIALFLIAMALCSTLGAQEHYLRFVEKSRKEVNSVITRTVSIDRVSNDTIYAYANPDELNALLALGYEPELLPHPSSVAKNIVMATTIQQMSQWDRYPTYEVYQAMMKRFVANHPTLCQLDSIGTTPQGRQLYMLRLTSNVAEPKKAPEVLYTSTMHGDEAAGFVLMLRLADYLLTSYSADERVKRLLDSTIVFINPNANPDGSYKMGNHTVSNSTRSNANLKDLNRNFPDLRVGENPDGPYQPETLAMMEFATQRRLVLAANLHGGIELVNFPWDAWTSNVNKHADHNWFYHISRQYATLAQDNSPASYFTGRDNGVTHGGDWYVVSGGRQDYMNYFHGCREVILEISNTKLPSSALLPSLWNYNRDALLTYLERVHFGFKGRVTSSSHEPLEATVFILGHDKDSSQVRSCASNGMYYRPIEPGDWSVTYSAPGYATQTHTISVSQWDTLVVKNVVLTQMELKVWAFDAETGVALNGAAIEIIGGNGGRAYTNQQGNFSFSDIPEGDVTIRVKKDGYVGDRKSVAIEAGTTNVTFNLHKGTPEAFSLPRIPDGFTVTGQGWSLSNLHAVIGGQSLQSASLTSGQSSTLSIPLYIAHPCDIAFAFRTQSTAGELTFYINNQRVGKWDGQHPWSEASFPVEAGQNTFSWDFKNSSGVQGQTPMAWLDSIVFPPSHHKVLFSVKDDKDELVTDAWVSLGDQTRATNLEGVAVFSAVPRGSDVPFLVSKSGYTPQSGAVRVGYVDVSKLVSIEQGNSQFDITFTVTHRGGVVEGALVEMGDTAGYTNAHGVVTFTSIESNSYEYHITAPNYTPYHGVVLLNRSTTLYISLQPLPQFYTLTLRVVDGESSPMPSVWTSISWQEQALDIQKQTDSLGLAVYPDLPQGYYAYGVSAPGFYGVDGALNLLSDTSLTLALRSTSIWAMAQRGGALEVWPNPSHGEVNLRFVNPANGLVQSELICVASGKTQVIYKGVLNAGEHTLQWNSNAIGVGVYIVRVTMAGGTMVTRLVMLR